MFHTEKDLILGGCCRDTGRAQGDYPGISKVLYSLRVGTNWHLPLMLLKALGIATAASINILMQESTAPAADGDTLPLHLIYIS